MENTRLNFKFTTLPNATGTIANIFIHGYSAGHHLEDRRLLINSISASMRNCVNIFVFWNSSHYSRFGLLSRGVIFAASRVHPAAALATVAADRAIHFTKIRSRANALGKDFFSHLGEYLRERHPEVSRLNLVGHSLGGRLLAHALMTPPLLKEHRFEIGDAMFMGAAVEVTPYQTLMLKQRIEGRLINAYSPKDDTLMLNIGEDSLGRRRVDGFMNWPMTDVKENFGHTDYWPNLTEVLSHTCFAGFGKDQIMTYENGLEAAEKDPIAKDVYLYSLLRQTPDDVQNEATKHLKTSDWTSISNEERDLPRAFTREFQLLSGHFLVNTFRGSGITYTQALDSLADHFDLSGTWHRCGSVIEAEEMIISTAFRHAFSSDHPMALSLSECIDEMSQQDYFRQIDALAKQLTVASYFNRADESVEEPTPNTVKSTSVAPLEASSFQPSLLWKVMADLQAASDKLTRVATNARTALKPAYSALIPAIAVLYYARRRLGDEQLM
ncbi:UNVERIFIED_ORG: hypothetical protein OKW25_002623 [Pseudomonas vranovensis]|nr:DUF726 domain-containing protein [Pseudomonas donghuensis]MDF9893476.1 hypothetical protein [Pseudomonas vranovensis]